jgi:hypothetical protein
VHLALPNRIDAGVHLHSHGPAREPLDIPAPAPESWAFRVEPLSVEPPPGALLEVAPPGLSSGALVSGAVRVDLLGNRDPSRWGTGTARAGCAQVHVDGLVIWVGPCWPRWCVVTGSATFIETASLTTRDSPPHRACRPHLQTEQGAACR